MIPTISVKISTLVREKASIGASVALASDVITDDALDTGIDGPKAATLADANGNATFAVTPGTKVGVKRFIVKARSESQTNAASAMLTLIHAPVGAPVLNSVPIVGYTYGGGTSVQPRFLTGSAVAIRQLDARDEAKIFSRTGQVWRAFTDISAAAGLEPVCQFFGQLTNDGQVTHFFTANAQECSTLRALCGAREAQALGSSTKAWPFMR